MRLLCVGYPLPNQAIDNYNVLTAPSYYDYDAVFIDPASITTIAQRLVEGGPPLTSYDDRPVINGITTAAAVSAADQVHRRLKETQTLLEQGGVVIVMARPNATQAGLLGFEGCDRYSWLPAPEGLSWSAPLLQAAEGTNIRITDDTNPASALVREYRQFFQFRAVFDGRNPAFQRSAHVWAEARPGLPVGVEFQLMGGRVCFVPPFSGETDGMKTQLAAAVVDTARALLAERVRETPPFWITYHAVPGLEEAEGDVAEQERAVRQASELLEGARARVNDAAVYRDLLWADGYVFREAVRRSLVLLGFEDLSGQDSLLALRDGEAEVLVELESVGGQVAEWPYIRLQRRLDERLRKDSKLLKGVIIANGHRTTQPAARQNPLSEPLQVACQNYRYALLTAEALFEVVRAALEGADVEMLSAIRRRILRGAGLLPFDVLLGSTADSQDEGTLF